MGIAFTIFGGVLGICACVVLIWAFSTITNKAIDRDQGRVEPTEPTETLLSGWELRAKYKHDYQWAVKEFGTGRGGSDVFVKYSCVLYDDPSTIEEFDRRFVHRSLSDLYDENMPLGFKDLLKCRVVSRHSCINVEPVMREFIDIVSEIRASEDLSKLFYKYGVKDEVTMLGKLSECQIRMMCHEEPQTHTSRKQRLLLRY